LENIRDFGHGTGGTVGQPIARHFRSVAKRVECGIVDCWCGRKVEHDDGNLGAPHHWQHGGRERICRDIEEDEIDVGAAQFPACCVGALGAIDEPQIDDFRARPFELLRDATDIPFKPFLKSGKLGPVSVQSNSEKPDANEGDIHLAKISDRQAFRNVANDLSHTENDT